MITNAKEFWENIKPEPKLKNFAEQHPDFKDFWNNCERADWMVMLLKNLGYKNTSKLWQVFQAIREKEKQNISEKELEIWRKEFNLFLSRYEKDHVAAWIYIEMALSEELADAIRSAKFMAGVTARLNQESETKVEFMREETGKDKEESVLKEQAQLLKQFLFNPFEPLNISDFDNL